MIIDHKMQLLVMIYCIFAILDFYRFQFLQLSILKRLRLKMVENRIVSAVKQDGDHRIDTSLRPKTLSHYVGQQALKDNLEISIKAAQHRGEPLDHVLL